MVFKKNVFKIVVLNLVIALASCSPHGDISRVTRVGGGTAEISLPSLFGGKAKTQVASGSTSNQVTAGQYKVNLNIGSKFTQTSTTTGSNYKVFTSFNKKVAQ